MGKHAFVLPTDLELRTDGDSLVLSYPGNIVLEQDLGLRVVRIEAGGDLTLRTPIRGGELVAGEMLRSDHPVDAERLTAKNIRLTSATIKCQSISATETIGIGPSTLQVDAILAPTIEIHPEATGRVTVIQSHNERGATKIKGGFSLTEYDELFGNSEVFLSERDLQPLPDTEPLLMVASLPPTDDEDEDTEDPLSLSDDDLLPLVTEEEVDDLFRTLQDAVIRITRCYDGSPPEAVATLSQLVSTRDYGILKAKITDLWSQLLGYHQERGIRPHHQVTHAFNVIHGLLQ